MSRPRLVMAACSLIILLAIVNAALLIFTDWLSRGFLGAASLLVVVGLLFACFGLARASSRVDHRADR